MKAAGFVAQQTHVIEPDVRRIAINAGVEKLAEKPEEAYLRALDAACVFCALAGDKDSAGSSQYLELNVRMAGCLRVVTQLFVTKDIRTPRRARLR